MKLLQIAICTAIASFPSLVLGAAKPDAAAPPHVTRLNIPESNTPAIQLAQNRVRAPAPVYAPGGHAIIPSAPQRSAPNYVPAPQPMVTPTYRAPGPTYAPGGHAIIPTAPQAPVRTYRAPRQSPQYSSTPTYNRPTYQPNYNASGPTYAPGGHAIIPTVPQQQVPAMRAPTFSPSFSTGGRTTPSTTPNQFGSTRLNLSPATTNAAPSIRQNNQPLANQTSATTQSRSIPRQPSFTGAFGGSTQQNAFRNIGGQTTPAVVGTIPPITAGRLQLAPQQPNRGQKTTGAIANQNTGTRLNISPVATGTLSSTRQNSQGAGASPSPVSGRSQLTPTGAFGGLAQQNAFQNIGGQTTPAVVGTVPLATAGRLQLTPQQPSPAQRTTGTIANQNAGTRLNLSPATNAVTGARQNIAATPATAGQIPAQTPARLQLTPPTSQSAAPAIFGTHSNSTSPTYDPKKIDPKIAEQRLDQIQTGLAVAGAVPVIGTPADLANAGISLARRRPADAALNAASAVPVIGEAAAGARLVKGAARAADAANVARSAQIADKIADGHAFAKHSAEFPGIENQKEFSSFIQNIMNHPSNAKPLSNGRTAYWDNSSGTVVIHDPRSVDGGTAFKPNQGKAYYDKLR